MGCGRFRITKILSRFNDVFPPLYRNVEGNIKKLFLWELLFIWSNSAISIPFVRQFYNAGNHGLWHLLYLVRISTLFACHRWWPFHLSPIAFFSVRRRRHQVLILTFSLAYSEATTRKGHHSTGAQTRHFIFLPLIGKHVVHAIQLPMSCHCRWTSNIRKSSTLIITQANVVSMCLLLDCWLAG